MIRENFAIREKEPARRLVDGNDIMKVFGLEPSPLIGKLLNQLEELQAIGKVASKQDALKACGKILKNI